MRIYVAGHGQGCNPFLTVETVKREGVEERPFAIELVVPHLKAAKHYDDNVVIDFDGVEEIDKLIEGLKRVRGGAGAGADGKTKVYL
jgi:hypothetical protein